MSVIKMPEKVFIKSRLSGGVQPVRGEDVLKLAGRRSADLAILNGEMSVLSEGILSIWNLCDRSDTEEGRQIKSIIDSTIEKMKVIEQEYGGLSDEQEVEEISAFLDRI